MSDTVKLTINGEEVQVPAGTNLIEASKCVGADIPHFCYHSHLSVAGNCRMCLVEVEKMRGLPIACNTVATEGMVVNTETDSVKEARAAVMEFLLVNHPIDCPVCDQAGECKLQIYYMEHDRRESVVSVDEKVKKGKALEVGPRVMLDQERCVACSRCVRFCDEVTGTGELRLLNRGDHTTIDTFPGVELANEYSVNTVDICPVGALTSRDFRFQARVWYLKHDDTICPGCATGCNVDLSHYRQVELSDYNGVAYRLRPRVNDEVNQAWMCDYGRDEYERVNDGRLRHPIAHSVEIGWEGAMTRLSHALAPLMKEGGSVAGVASFDCTNEEIEVFRRVMKTAFGEDRIAVVAQRAPGHEDDFLIDGDKHANRKGTLMVAGDGAVSDLAAHLRDRQAVVVLDANVMGAHHGDEVHEAFMAVKHRIVLSAQSSETTELATIVLPTVSFAEKDGTWVNRQGRVQRIRRILDKGFDCRDDIEVLTMIPRALGCDFDAKDAAAVFAELAARVPAFAGLDWESIGDLGRQLEREAATAGEGGSA